MIDLAQNAPTTKPLAHHGRSGPLVRMVLLNFLLSVLTLSLWRFWGRTRVRRYLWGTTTAWGDAPEYTGTGRELFLGFLVMLVVVLLPVVVAAGAVQVLSQSGNPLAVPLAGLLQVVVLFLVFAALYRARRYRLSRTEWRGIRGGQGGSAVVWALMSLASWTAAGMTMGWTLPWTEMALARYQWRHTRIGDRSFDCSPRLRPVYSEFLGSWIAALVLLPMALLLVAALAWVASEAGVAKPYVQVGSAAGGVLAVMFGLVGPYARYKAAFYRELAAGTSFAGTRFAFEPGKWRLVRLALGNWLGTALTLGLLRPWAVRRTLAFFCETLRVDGTPDFAAIHASAEAAPRLGEGVLSVLDGAGEF
ncbi:MAG: DUF898 family protein [Actinomycetota bacterium]